MFSKILLILPIYGVFREILKETAGTLLYVLVDEEPKSYSTHDAIQNMTMRYDYAKPAPAKILPKTQCDVSGNQFDLDRMITSNRTKKTVEKEDTQKDDIYWKKVIFCHIFVSYIHSQFSATNK